MSLTPMFEFAAFTAESAENTTINHLPNPSAFSAVNAFLPFLQNDCRQSRLILTDCRPVIS
jgi:hypothetical protein